MKWLELFGKRERKRGTHKTTNTGQASVAEVPGNRTTADDPEAENNALLELSRRLAYGQDSVVREVVEAILDKDAYLMKRFDRLDQRGIDRPIQELPWFALVEELIENGLAAEIDWKQDGDTVIDVVGNLLERKNRLADERRTLNALAKENLFTHDLLKSINRVLEAGSTALACLDIESDSYVLIVVPQQELDALQKLATQARYRIEGFAG